MQTIKVPVQHISLTAMAEAGWELDDNGYEEREIYAQFCKEEMLATVTPRQRKIIQCLSLGMTRRQIAIKLHVSLQEIHQIILRIRKRLKERAGVLWKK